MKINENGRSMVEMLGVIAIIGVLSAAGLAGYSKAMYKHKMNQTIDIFTQVLERFYEIDKKPSKRGTVLNSMQDLKNYFMPDCKDNGDDGCKLPLGNLYFQAEYWDYWQVNWYINNLPSKACVDFLSHHWESIIEPELISETKGGLISVWTTDGGYYYIYHPSDGKTQKPAHMKDIVDACNRCPVNDCSIEITFRGYL